MSNLDVCRCDCHNENGPRVKHIVACCYTCKTCNERIKLVASQSHERDCEKKQCEHRWVLDGHNAGDPICSKCFARE